MQEQQIVTAKKQEQISKHNQQFPLKFPLLIIVVAFDKYIKNKTGLLVIKYFIVNNFVNSKNFHVLYKSKKMY